MAGKIDLDALVSARIALEEVNDALAATDRGDVARSIITHG